MDHPANQLAIAQGRETYLEPVHRQMPISVNPDAIQVEVYGQVHSLSFQEIISLQKRGVDVYLLGAAYGVR